MDHTITIKLECDQDTENPFDNDTAWRIVFFDSRKWIGAQSPDSEEFHTVGFKSKLNAGTAFVLDYCEHGGSAWSISGTGMNCMWDISHGAGLLICDDKTSIGAKTYAERHASAKQMLDVYNAWANGACLYFSVDVTEVDGEEVDIPLDSCGGFIMVDDDDKKYVMNDYLIPAITAYLKESGDAEPNVTFEVEGCMDYLICSDDVLSAYEAIQS